jgi:hypothetical protein
MAVSTTKKEQRLQKKISKVEGGTKNVARLKQLKTRLKTAGENRSQKATGTTASKARMGNMVNKVHKTLTEGGNILSKKTTTVSPGFEGEATPEKVSDRRSHITSSEYTPSGASTSQIKEQKYNKKAAAKETKLKSMSARDRNKAWRRGEVSDAEWKKSKSMAKKVRKQTKKGKKDAKLERKMDKGLQKAVSKLPKEYSKKEISAISNISKKTSGM